MALDLIAELEGLVDAFDREGIEYALCGGIALGMLGHPRATMDIDMLVLPEIVERAADAAKSCGFDIPGRKMIFGLRTNTPREMRRLSKIDPETGRLMPVDLMVVAHEYVEVWANRLSIPVGSRTFHVVSREGLIAMKRIAGRPQDLADIAKLEGTESDEG